MQNLINMFSAIYQKWDMHNFEKQIQITEAFGMVSNGFEYLKINKSSEVT